MTSYIFKGKTGFQLPPDVSYEKQRLSDAWAYVFRHRVLGELGRILLQELDDGRCGSVVAMLIFAPEATDPGRFQDYARKMYPQYNRLNVPTWIIWACIGRRATHRAPSRRAESVADAGSQSTGCRLRNSICSSSSLLRGIAVNVKGRG